MTAPFNTNGVKIADGGGGGGGAPTTLPADGDTTTTTITGGGDSGVQDQLKINSQVTLDPVTGQCFTSTIKQPMF